MRETLERGAPGCATGSTIDAAAGSPMTLLRTHSHPFPRHRRVSTLLLSFLLLLLLSHLPAAAPRRYDPATRLHLRERVRELFTFGYDSYMRYAYPKDELNPIDCEGRGPDCKEITAPTTRTACCVHDPTPPPHDAVSHHACCKCLVPGLPPMLGPRVDRLPVLGSKRVRLPRVRLLPSPPHVLDSDLNLPLATASI